MNCDQARPLLQLYADGELDAARIPELEAHLRDCANCTPAWSQIQQLRKALRQESLYFTAPAAMREKIAASLRPFAPPQPARTTRNWNWLTAAFGGFATACLAALFALWLIRPSAQQLLARDIVASHVRSLMANHALDVASTDQHTVKPWFNGKLDFSPPTPDLAAQGFPLIGGRLDYLDGHPVAALVYQRHKHVINVFIWPTKTADTTPNAVTTIQGYNLVKWSAVGMAFWAVSDVNSSDLLQFAQDFGH